MNQYYIFFSKLADPLRIKILSSLKAGEKSVGKLAKELRIEQSKLSHALQSLKACSIVHAKKSGKQRIYSLNKKTILPIFNLIDRHEKKFCKCCCVQGKQ
jgi:ArsR family transcriptional regulator